MLEPLHDGTQSTRQIMTVISTADHSRPMSERRRPMRHQKVAPFFDNAILRESIIRSSRQK